MRLFVGVGLGRDLAARLAPQSRRERNCRAPDMRLVEPRDYHLTLVFLGRHPPSVLAEVLAGLAAIGSRHAPFKCRIHGSSLLPSVYRPRALVANVEYRPQLRDLQAELQNAVAGLLPGESPRDYFPLITLARGGRRQRAIPGRASRVDRRAIEGILPVQAITLYQSLPQPAMGRYLPLARVALSRG